jgi:regulator of RNase E activity RraA
VLAADAKRQGLPSATNQKVIDLLQLNDVPVVDLMGPAPGHNFGGDNLQAAIYGVTRTGALVDGTVRDLEGLFDMPTQIYFRDGHPAAVAGVTVIGINTPVKRRSDCYAWRHRAGRSHRHHVHPAATCERDCREKLN